VIGRLTLRPRAWRDITEHLAYLEDQEGLELAERMLGALQFSFAELANMPKIGSPCSFKAPSLRSLRRWPVKDFENWLIFYLTTRRGVEIIRVLHGSRDIDAIFT